MTFRFIILLAFVSLTGCVQMGHLKPLSSDRELSESDAFIYGKFELHRTGYQISGIWISLLKDNQEHSSLLQFKKKDNVLAVLLEPGQYRIDKFVFAPGGPGGPSMWTKSEITEIPIEGELAFLDQKFIVRKGGAVYLGDFIGFTGRAPSEELFTFGFKGGVSSVANNFLETTDNLNSKYPELKGYRKLVAPYLESLAVNKAKQAGTH